jgi:hypothetical protein
MAHVRVHLDHLGIERVEIVPEKGALPQEAFDLTGSLGKTLLALDHAIRGHFLRFPTQPRRAQDSPLEGVRQ